MTQNSKIEVLHLMREMGMVPLFYHSDTSVAKQVLQACYDGGARLLEFTARGDFAFDVFAELSAYAQENLEGMILGVGSITDTAAASLYMQMGARFVVTPSLREDIVKICNPMPPWNCTARPEANTALSLAEALAMCAKRVAFSGSVSIAQAAL